MKKIMFFVMTVVALAFVSCSGSGVATETTMNDSIANDSDTVVVDSAALDSVVVDSIEAVKE